jgi:hypothetical protein
MNKIVHGATPAHVHVRQMETKYTVEDIKVLVEEVQIEPTEVLLEQIIKTKPLKINWEGVDNGEQTSK